MEAEAGMLPTRGRWRVATPVVQMLYGPWLREMLDALPRVVARKGTAG